MALLLYGGWGNYDGGGVTHQYYIPVCSSGVWQYVSATNNYVCIGGTWSWSENKSGNPGCTVYVDKVRAQTVPQ